MKVSILGGGQLARMLALAGHPMGLDFLFLDPSADACAAAVGKHLQGAYDDSELLKQMAKQAGVVTFEFENVPATSIERLAANAPTYPPARALSVAQDRLKEKNLLRELKIPVPQFAAVNSLAELEAAVTSMGLPAVLKTRTQGYDGKGQAVLRQPEDTERAWQKLQGAPALLEAFVPFERELSIIAARSCQGDMVFYPVSENTHHEGILHFSVSRPDDHMQQQAEAFSRQVAEALDYVGVLTLELFQAGNKLLANEIAPPGTQLWPLDHRRSGNQSIRKPPASDPRSSPRGHNGGRIQRHGEFYWLHAGSICGTVYSWGAYARLREGESSWAKSWPRDFAGNRRTAHARTAWPATNDTQDRV
ncbi:MAG: ATP-grasp domain-containing protein [Motiliproteus sp.]